MNQFIQIEKKKDENYKSGKDGMDSFVFFDPLLKRRVISIGF